MKKYLIAFLFLSTFQYSNLAIASGVGSLEKCTSIKRQIEHYAKLRKLGGKAQKMEYWRREMGEKEDIYRKLKCRKHGIIRL